MTTATPSSTRHTKIPLPLWLDRLVIRVAQWPWWALLIMFGLIFMFYSFATSYFYRNALHWEFDLFQPTTDQFNTVDYNIRTPDGGTTEISGILTTPKDDKSITVITQVEDCLLYTSPSPRD